jgi:hypothetical protein
MLTNNKNSNICILDNGITVRNISSLLFSVQFCGTSPSLFNLFVLNFISMRSISKIHFAWILNDSRVIHTLIVFIKLAINVSEPNAKPLLDYGL